MYTKLFNGTIHDIYFKGNYVQDARPLVEEDGANLHFVAVSDLYIENNTFENKTVLGSGNYIRLYNTREDITMKNLNIKNNKFINLNPDNRYVYFEKNDGAGDITDVTVTGNKITSSKNKIPFVLANFSTADMTIKDNKVSGKSSASVKSGDVANTSFLRTLAASNKKRKQTNKVEKYYSDVASQYAYFTKNAKKTNALYTHIKGHKNWEYAAKKLKDSKATKVYVDMRADASSGKWYRIRFTSSTKSPRYWIRASALSFDKIEISAYNKELTTMQNYPLYTRVFNDPLLAKTVGTTAADLPRTVTVSKRAVKTTQSGSTSTYYYIPSKKVWTRAVAFY
ncbi:hypothetical protein [Secundilactobacillus oryzae]|uniref:hypothetical protein n=1 Tax=Secundilactobacillus oryzae TaxID=1202668 RepID=UPI0006D0351C|nr:hypothetical protein [Secundilactobacillus oryzae]